MAEEEDLAGDWHKDDLPRARVALGLMRRWQGTRWPSGRASKMVDHPDHAELVSFGKAYPWVVVRLMIEEFRAGRVDHWFLALFRITGARNVVPAPDHGNLSAMAAYWIHWWDTSADALPFRYPEHAKVEKLKEKSQAVGDFLDSTRLVLCRRVVRRYVPVEEGIEQILADHYGVDRDRLHMEKDDMVETLRRRTQKET